MSHRLKKKNRRQARADLREKGLDYVIAVYGVNMLRKIRKVDEKRKDLVA